MARTPLEACVHATVRRIRAQRALEGAVLAAVGGFALVGLAVWHARGMAQSAIGLLLVAPLLGGLIQALLPVRPLEVARLLDRTHGLADLLSSAWTFVALPPAERSRFMQATCDSAQLAAERVSSERAAPWSWPKHGFALLLTAAGVLCLLQLSRPAPPRPEPPQAAAARTPVLDEDDTQALSAELGEVLARGQSTDETRNAARELDALLQTLADGSTDQASALAELRTLEARLERESARADELSDALRELGRTFGGAASTRELRDALSSSNAERARDALRALAKRAGAGNTARKQLEELSRSLLERKKRELERLDRKKPEDRARPAQRELERLSRELDQAAQSLSRAESSAAAESLERAADEAERVARTQSGAQQARALAERARTLRELLRRQAGGDSRSSGTGDEQRGAMGRGQQRGREGQRGQGEPGADGRARGDAKAGRQSLSLERFRALAKGASGAAAQNLRGSTAGSADNSATGAGLGGGPPKQAATPTPGLPGARKDVHVAGQATAGSTRSEVIYEAAGRGFVARDYQKVHADYARHAESQIERDEIPGGYRFYVKRYFQLIRPRQDVHD